VLRQFAAAPTGWSMEPGDLDVKVYGDTAILTGVLKVTPAGASAPARTSRFRKVFIRRHGRWYMVSLQGARLTP
jgi:ketosteroid isomerase-like protein